MASASISNIYQLKITLKETEPPVWRRIQIPEKYSFSDLHWAILDAMDWNYCHLRQFMMINEKKIVVGELNEDEFTGTIPEDTAKIAEYFLSPNDKANYFYGNGDGWHHEVLLEKILPAVEGILYPQCIDGEMACPPEDCGGISGYQHLKEVMANPQHEEYADCLKRVGHRFDPASFDLESIDFVNPWMRKCFGWE